MRRVVAAAVRNNLPLHSFETLDLVQSTGDHSMAASKFLSASAGLSALALAAFLAPSQAAAAPAGAGLSSLGSVDTQHVQHVQWRGRGGYYRGRGYGYRGYG